MEVKTAEAYKVIYRQLFEIFCTRLADHLPTQPQRGFISPSLCSRLELSKQAQGTVPSSQPKIVYVKCPYHRITHFDEILPLLKCNIIKHKITIEHV